MSNMTRPNPYFKTVEVVPGGKHLDCCFDDENNQLLITLPIGEVGKSTIIYVERVYPDDVIGAAA